MTITVALTEEEEARLNTLANDRGLSPDALVHTLVREIIARETGRASVETNLTPAEREKQVEEVFKFFDEQDISAEVNEAAFHRANWYR